MGQNAEIPLAAVTGGSLFRSPVRCRICNARMDNPPWGTAEGHPRPATGTLFFNATPILSTIARKSMIYFFIMQLFQSVIRLSQGGLLKTGTSIAN